MIAEDHQGTGQIADLVRALRERDRPHQVAFGNRADRTGDHRHRAHDPAIDEARRKEAEAGKA